MAFWVQGWWAKARNNGDVIWWPPNEKHWHGATPTTGMTHIAIQQALDGKVVEWMQKVSYEQYQASLGEE